MWFSHAKGYMSILYVDCIKFLINRFVGNFYLYNIIKWSDKWQVTPLLLFIFFFLGKVELSLEWLTGHKWPFISFIYIYIYILFFPRKLQWNEIFSVVTWISFFIYLFCLRESWTFIETTNITTSIQYNNSSNLKVYIHLESKTQTNTDSCYKENPANRMVSLRWHKPLLEQWIGHTYWAKAND